jgi:anti-sigma factor RsiW
MTCGFADLDGSYVLGALSPAERMGFERHLAACEECTRAVAELAGLPGLLGRVDPAVLEQPTAGAPPATLLPALFREVRRTRRRRALTTAGLAAAASALVVLVPVGLSEIGDASPSVGSDPDSSQTPVEAR